MRGACMHIDVGDDRALTAEPVQPGRLRRLCGFAVTFIVGPALVAYGVVGLQMGPVEAAAVLILVSFWLGPRLIRDV